VCSSGVVIILRRNYRLAGDMCILRVGLCKALDVPGGIASHGSLGRLFGWCSM
jgi:hypothetical protein